MLSVEFFWEVFCFGKDFVLTKVSYGIYFIQLGYFSVGTGLHSLWLLRPVLARPSLSAFAQERVSCAKTPFPTGKSELYSVNFLVTLVKQVCL